MIQLPRALARQFRTVLRKSVLTNGLRSVATWAVVQAGQRGLTLRSQNSDVAIQLHQDGPRPSETLALPTQALADFEGRDETLVTLEPKGSTSVHASWQDGVVPQERVYDSLKLKELAPFPESPAESIAQPEGFLEAMQAAAATTARDSMRYVLTHLQLRASGGQIVATDGRHVLSQSGFSFPWEGDRLVPALPVFGCRELGHDAVHVGCTEDYVAIALGPWQIYLRMDKEGKFPAVEQVVPDLAKAVARLHLSLEDAEFLLQTLPRLPGVEDETAPVTLECNGRFAIRARGEGQKHATEAVLSKSAVSGQAFRCNSSRDYLRRAVKLGLREFYFFDPDLPILAQDAQRRYLWQVLNREGVIGPDADDLRIASDAMGANSGSTPSVSRRNHVPVDTPRTSVVSTEIAPRTQPRPILRRKSTVSTPTPTADLATHANGAAPAVGSNGSARRKAKHTSIPALIKEAETLKDILRDALGRSHGLLVALRRQKKQAQVVQSTLAALKGLQKAER